MEKSTAKPTMKTEIEEITYLHVRLKALSRAFLAFSTRSSDLAREHQFEARSVVLLHPLCFSSQI